MPVNSKALGRRIKAARKKAAMTQAGLAEEEPPLRLTVRAFGRLRVLLPDGQELHWRTRKAQELFAYLFHRGGALVERERLLDILWPQSAPSNATSLLHTSLYSIRKSLAPYGLDQLLLREKKGYRMDMELVESDRDAMDAACAGEGKAEDVSALCEGPYLEDIEAAWAEDSRAWYAGAFLRLCRAQAEEKMERGEYPAAADYLRAAASQEPYDEGLTAQLLRCYAARGEVNNAMALCQAARSKTDIRQRQITALESAVNSTRQLMSHSESTYLEVLTAQQTLLSARLSQIADRFDAIQGMVSLYQALGGGTYEGGDSVKAGEQEEEQQPQAPQKRAKRAKKPKK